MFTQIIFPVDFSGSSIRVIPYVCNAAKKYEARIHVLHVLQDARDLYVPGEAVVQFISDIRESAQNMMQEYVEEHFKDYKDAYGHVLEGDPVDEIVNFAQENGKSLIIMSTHGRKGLDRIVFGSIAENVVRTSPTPVMTVNPYLIDAENLV